MAAVDYGVILRIDGEFVNKNGELIMEENATPYICRDKEGAEFRIDGHCYAYVGDEECLLAFDRTSFLMSASGEIVVSQNGLYTPAETFYRAGLPTLHVQYLDKEGTPERFEQETWSDYVKECWNGASGTERLEDLGNGRNEYRKFLRRTKRIARINRTGKCYRENRYLATWKYKGHNYEVIYGYGIDPKEAVWNSIKDNSGYDFTETEKQIIDSWFGTL